MTRSEFEQTARELRAEMLKVALDFFGSRDDAEDVTQDAMLQLWRYCEQIDSSRNVKGLAIRVAKNCCVSHYRKQRHEAGHTADIVNLKAQPAEGSPQERLEAEDTRRMMTEVMALLKPRERELFEMRRLDGLSMKEITEQTGIPRSSVSAMVSAARMKVFLELKKKNEYRMKQEDIQKLIDRYLEGTTTPDEERQLARELLHLDKDATEEWQAIRLMLGELAMGEAEYDALIESRCEAAAESPRQEGNKRAAIVSMRRWIAAAVCLLLVVGIGIKVLNTEEHQQQPLTAQTVEKAKTETEKPEAQQSEAQQSEAQKPEVQESATAKPQTASPQQEVQEGKAQPQKAKKAVPASPKSSQPKDTLPKESPTQKTKPVPLMQTKKDPNLHYAAHEISKDTLPYQDPARVDSFVARLADYHEVKEGELKCSATQDSNVVSAVYVFPDKKEVDVFGRMLQVACWYHDATPGYLLTFSHQQFFFELKDMHRQLHYRWIAERINGKILLYCTHAPLGTKVSSTCYQEYRDELMHIKSINTKTREI